MQTQYAVKLQAAQPLMCIPMSVSKYHPYRKSTRSAQSVSTGCFDALKRLTWAIKKDFLIFLPVSAINLLADK